MYPIKPKSLFLRVIKDNSSAFVQLGKDLKMNRSAPPVFKFGKYHSIYCVNIWNLKKVKANTRTWCKMIEAFTAIISSSVEHE